MLSNDRAGISVSQPRGFEERVEVAQKCAVLLKATMPMLVDGIDDRVGHAYSGMPDRLYVIDPDGKVAYKSGRGPFGFVPGEMEQSLALLLLERGIEPKPLKLEEKKPDTPAAPATKGDLAPGRK